MTYQEFLTELRKTPRDWYISRQAMGCIRRRNNQLPSSQCPISSLQNKDLLYYDFVSTSLGLNFIRRDIVVAADAKPGYNEQMRRDLLDACGLTE